MPKTCPRGMVAFRFIGFSLEPASRQRDAMTRPPVFLLSLDSPNCADNHPENGRNKPPLLFADDRKSKVAGGWAGCPSLVKCVKIAVLAP